MKAYIHSSEENSSNTFSKKRYAIVLLVKEIMCQVDDIASLQRQGCQAKLSRSLLKETCAVLHEVEEEVSSLYLELLPQLVGKSNPVPKNIFKENYEHLMVNPRLKFIEKMRSEFNLRKSA